MKNLILITFLTLSCTTYGAVLINPSFEESPLGFFETGDDLFGWSVSEGDVQVLDNFASDGEISVILNAKENGSICQTIETIPGHVYELTFDMSRAEWVSESFTQVDIFIDNELIRRVSQDSEEIIWNSYMIPFAANDSSTIIRLKNPRSQYYTAVDNVIVETPEPAMLALLGISFLFLPRKVKNCGKKE